MRALCELDVTSMQVWRVAKAFDEKLESRRQRPIWEVPHLVLDARYEKVRHGGSVVDCAVLMATKVRLDGKRSVLGVSVSLSEAEAHWREFNASLQERGMHGVRFVTSDDHPGAHRGAGGTVGRRSVAAASMPPAAQRSGGEAMMSVGRARLLPTQRGPARAGPPLASIELSQGVRSPSLLREQVREHLRVSHHFLDDRILVRLVCDLVDLCVDGFDPKAISEAPSFSSELVCPP